MGTYNIPRNVKGEGRFLYIFSTKSLIYFVVGAVIGLPFYFIFAAMKLNIVGIIIVVLLGFIGFAIATFKIPEIGILKSTRTIGGQKIDDIIVRAFKFRKKGNKLYLYNKQNTKEENKNG